MNNKSIHIILDFDGTLWDSSLSVRKSLEYALRDKGYLDLSSNLPEFEIGKPMEIILEQKFNFSNINAKEVATLFRIYLTEEDLKYGRFYSNVEKIIVNLFDNGYKLSIATFKREELVNKILKQYKVENYFYQVRGLKEDCFMSKTELVKECISKKDSIVIMIGDTISDYTAALDNNIVFYLVKYGYGYENLKSKVNKENIKVISHFEEILSINELNI
ncbi:MAG: hypothetical protein CL624_12580 [Arcobacter sp.]|nr:hypothetical protein [Arcobacter sp.]|tara:strand:+ start:5758 stop:6411 length:654 start_codon:yes stop_codon:yes gene_type:complete